MYKNIAQIIKANRKAGQHWFRADAMNYFNTVIEANGQVFEGRYFVTSDRLNESDPKRYTLRVADDDGNVTTVGRFREHATVTHARHAIPTY